MVFRLVIAGVSQCNSFSKVCLLADYLQQNLSNFCYQRIEKPVIEWENWLSRINKLNRWHHMLSPIVWKELLVDGSKPVYIGSTQEFLEYCYSYYNFDVFLAAEKLQTLSQNNVQFNLKHKIKQQYEKINSLENDKTLKNTQECFKICISGSDIDLTMHLISGILELCYSNARISTICLFNMNCSSTYEKLIEKEFSFLNRSTTGNVVILVDKIGNALTNSDIFIILDHVPFRHELSIGSWLHSNKIIMERIAAKLNICGSSKIRIIFPNLGPACYNATILADRVLNIKKNNIIVATSNLGMELAKFISGVAEVPLQNMFCPPVWGFVGINHLVDIKTIIHRYDMFKPFDRHTKVKNSTLCIGTITPEMRTMEYILYFEETLWKKYAENTVKKEVKYLNKAIAVVNIIKIWFFDPNPEYVVNLGILCDGTFGLSFKGIFSQPAQLINGEWRPAISHLLPKDSQTNIYYLQDIANMILKLGENELPPLNTND